MKQKLSIINNILMFFGFLGVAFSGLIMRFRLVYGGYRGGRDVENVFWSWSRSDWSSFHNYVGLILTILIIIHLLLHWRWIIALPRLIRNQWKGLTNNNQ